jgi:methylated-DNA-[protein]-cysteine S-methyltransferase
MTAYATVDSPIGQILLTAEDGALTRLYMSPFTVDPIWEHDPGALAEPARQLAEYFAGERTDFALELLAAELGDPRKVRAVGLANGRNPISIVVPCHRVIGADGSLVGYGGGLERKRELLALEAEVAAGFRATLW